MGVYEGMHSRNFQSDHGKTVKKGYPVTLSGLTVLP